MTYATGLFHFGQVQRQRPHGVLLGTNKACKPVTVTIVRPVLAEITIVREKLVEGKSKSVPCTALTPPPIVLPCRTIAVLAWSRTVRLIVIEH